MLNSLKCLPDINFAYIKIKSYVQFANILERDKFIIKATEGQRMHKCDSLHH